MENYSYNSYPESGGSSPRSREIDFENPTPWEDQPTAHNSNNTNYKVKLMCSYGGKIHPRPHDNQLAYINGETKILAVDRSIKFSSLVSKLSSLCDADVCFKYQLPGEDLDALISVTNDDDLDHMMNEYDRLNRASPKPARLRLFLFPVTVQSPAHSFGSTEGRSERDRFVEALNSGPVSVAVQAPVPALNPVQAAGNADFLFGSEKGVSPVTVPVPKVPVIDPVTRQHDPEVTVLDDRNNIGTDRIQKHIQDLRRLRIAEDQQQQQQQQQQQNMYRDDYSGDYYVQRTPEKVATTTLPAQGYQISGGYAPNSLGTDQQPVYMVPAQSSVYHAPMARPVTGPIGHNPGQGPQGQGQGYYAVQRMPTEVYREQPVYNAMQPVTQPMFPPQQQQLQQQQQQKVTTHGEGVRMMQSTAGMGEGGYTQVAYDNNLGRHVYYTAQGAMVAQHQQMQQQQQQQQPLPLQQQQPLPPQQQHQVHLQPNTHQQQYQPVGVGATTNQIQDGKVINAPTKITQGSI